MAQKIFIDKFNVPANSKEEFLERMQYNRNFIKNLAGFIEDNAYEMKDNTENFVIVTVAVWENDEAITNAKQAVQQEYKQTDFNMAEFLKRLNITFDRGVYNKLN